MRYVLEKEIRYHLKKAVYLSSMGVGSVNTAGCSATEIDRKFKLFNLTNWQSQI